MTGSPESAYRLVPLQARELRGDLRRALTGFANGNGGLPVLLHQIERVAQALAHNPKATLDGARAQVRRFVGDHAPSRVDDTGLPGVGFATLYEKVRCARNDVAHTGTEAALAGRWSAALAIVTMEALAVAARVGKHLRVCDVMVSNPTCAHGWQSLADLRRTMLVNDYSCLPTADGAKDGRCTCVDAERLARHFLLNDPPAHATLDDATGSVTVEVPTVPQHTRVRDHLVGPGRRLPFVVVAKPTEIVGIVTAFDLL